VCRGVVRPRREVVQRRVPEAASDRRGAPRRALGKGTDQRRGVVPAPELLILRPFGDHTVLRLAAAQAEQFGCLPLQVECFLRRRADLGQVALGVLALQFAAFEANGDCRRPLAR
jgi:hypothetical protein